MSKCLTCGGHHQNLEGGAVYDVFIADAGGEVRSFVCDECIKRFPQMKAIKVVNPFPQKAIDKEG